VDDVAQAVSDRLDWKIEVNEQRPRPSGAASSHHVDDVVFRARRIGPTSSSGPSSSSDVRQEGVPRAS
jgi:hypothetical protein